MQVDPIVVSLFYFNEEIPEAVINRLKDIIPKVFSEATVLDQDKQPCVVKLKWDIRIISPKSGTADVVKDMTAKQNEELPKKCDILSFFRYAMDVGRPDPEHQIQVMESCVSKGCLDKGGELLSLGVMSGGRSIQDEKMLTRYCDPDFKYDEEERPKMSKALQDHHLTGCAINVIGKEEDIVEDYKSSIVNDVKSSVLQANIIGLKKVIDQIVQKKFDKVSTVFRATPKNTQSTPVTSQSTPEKELSDNEKYGEWKKAFPNTARPLSGETDGKRLQRLKPLFREFLNWSNENKSVLDADAPKNEGENARFFRHLKLYQEFKPDGQSQATTTQPSQTAVKKEASQPSVQTTARVTKEQMLEELNKLKEQFKEDFENGRSLDLKAEIEAEEREINKLGNSNPPPTSIEAPKAQVKLDFAGWRAMMGDRLDAGAPSDETAQERGRRRLKMFNEYKATSN